MSSPDADGSNPASMLERACAAARSGDFAAAEVFCRALLKSPDAFPAAVLLGEVLTAQNLDLGAIEAYEYAASLNPGHALPGTRAACMKLRLEVGRIPPPPAPGQARRVQLTTLGANGRLGNQILQYAFARLYARRVGAICELPEWIGRYLYVGSEDPLPSRPLPMVRESEVDLFASLRGELAGPHDCDLWGYFVNHTREWGPVSAEFRAIFELAPGIRSRFERMRDSLRARGRTLVAIHLRRSDFGYGPYWVAPTSWYAAWLEALWPTLDAPVLWISTDDPHSALRLQRFAPLFAADVGVGLQAAPFLFDHYMLSCADHVAIANSTFSVTAAMLNATATTFMPSRPASSLTRAVRSLECAGVAGCNDRTRHAGFDRSRVDSSTGRAGVDGRARR